ncbi:hypothetical protein [Cohnella lubricantis]|uniref:Uncharacterized protein n=1 Tax=Cohnella lubricantis TaxID=2163172 RepID=A0A841TFU0_9BACL|nr:hypothetical protein [Cohnella lubricantis]MBB6678809.1 hypothetical protein [Cohnella lubricantis]MBP2117348.1 hypothetical protein [Cohnella lubricantis]
MGMTDGLAMGKKVFGKPRAIRALASMAGMPPLGLCVSRGGGAVMGNRRIVRLLS